MTMFILITEFFCLPPNFCTQSQPGLLLFPRALDPLSPLWLRLGAKRPLSRLPPHVLTTDECCAALGRRGR